METAAAPPDDATSERPPAPDRPRATFRTSRRRLLTDRAARWVVTAGGMATIASILGILFFIVIEVLPVFRSTTIERVAIHSLTDTTPAAVLVDEHRTYAALFDLDGVVRILRLEDGAIVETLSPRPAGEGQRWTRVRTIPGEQRVAVATENGSVFTLEMSWDVRFDGSVRVVTPRLSRPQPFEFLPADAALSVTEFSVAFDDDGAAAGVAMLSDDELVFVRQSIEEDFMSGDRTVVWERTRTRSPAPLQRLLLDRNHSNIYGATDDGHLVWWPIKDGTPGTPQVVDNGSPITAMTFLIGDRSLITGDRRGVLGVWFPVRGAEGLVRLTRIRDTDTTGSSVIGLTPSPRDKGVLAVHDDGRMRLYYSTSDRLLWSGESPVGPTDVLFYAPKANGAVAVGDSRLALLDIDNPHPEMGWRALFGKVWYEGYSEPEYVWQSTGGTDDFEPKLSLTPLIVGTFKGTFYSLILAIPLAVLGAMYTSQFMQRGLKRFVKPTVELMAALPSVVLGFLAGLWLAPRIERILPALVAMVAIVPLFVLIAGYGWRSLPSRIRGRFPDGSEAILQMGVVAIAILFSLEINLWLEGLIFGGDVRQWLLDATGLRYDQRNALVVGLAMGFAVIPIIFSIAEDAFSNVPRNLVSGSLALGANRWQTVTRVVLPTASPGIFSGIMIGFGRAIGETMIVLMATGNTPLMDWSPFNGFRTLSANVAVEIPEAPQGATLYRALFLAALLLFVFTFIVNTGAELVRQRLRKRYAQL